MIRLNVISNRLVVKLLCLSIILTSIFKVSWYSLVALRNMFKSFFNNVVIVLCKSQSCQEKLFADSYICAICPFQMIHIRTCLWVCSWSFSPFPFTGNILLDAVSYERFPEGPIHVPEVFVNALPLIFVELFDALLPASCPTPIFQRMLYIKGLSLSFQI